MYRQKDKRAKGQKGEFGNWGEIWNKLEKKVFRIVSWPPTLDLDPPGMTVYCVQEKSVI